MPTPRSAFWESLNARSFFFSFKSTRASSITQQHRSFSTSSSTIPPPPPSNSFSSSSDATCSSPICRVHSSISDLTPFQRKHLLKLRTGSACIPETRKVARGERGVVDRVQGYGGEDAYLCLGSCSSYFVGVADGVSEWERLRIDAGLWSRSLLEGVQLEIKREVTDVLDPTKLMWSAFERNLNNKVLGSCTACFLTLASVERELSTANLGNSGYMLLRIQGDSLKLLHKSEMQEQSFGCPYQLGHHFASNKPSQSELAKHIVIPGDIIVAGTDGLFDNMTVEDITAILWPIIRTRWKERSAKVAKAIAAFAPDEPLAPDQCMSLACSPRELANTLANEAFETSVDRNRDTPFGAAYLREMNMVWKGGKQDDITIVIAFVELEIQL